jgi:thiol-disulfide isomerase/thioredoxin
MLGLAAYPAQARQASAPPPVDEASKAIEAVDAAYQAQVHAAQVARLKALEALVNRNESTAAGPITEAFFQTAIADDLFAEAEPLAGRVIALGKQATTDAWLLARIVDIVAKVDRGAVENSVTALQTALSTAPAEATTVISLLEVYYHQLLARREFGIALKAFEAARTSVKDPSITAYLDNRIARLAMIGKPSPVLKGSTIDGKPFDLASMKGKIVVVVFWASWCVPNAQEIEALVEVVQQYQDQGLEVVGVNMDTAQDDAGSLETYLPNIKRFLLDFNVTWPTLVNGSGAADYAAVFHVNDLPASVVINRQGTVIGIDPGVKGLFDSLPELLKAP